MLKRHLIIGSICYYICAFLDGYFTIKGINLNISEEGNKILLFMINSFGLIEGLFIGKLLVYLFSLLIAIVVYKGIDKDANFIYYFTLTKYTKMWMKRKKRYWISFLPLYLTAFSQLLASFSWIYLINKS